MYTIYNNSLEEVRDIDRTLCQDDDNSVNNNNNNPEKERGEERVEKGDKMIFTF